MYDDDDGPAEISLNEYQAIMSRPLPAIDASKITPQIQAMIDRFERLRPKTGDPWVDRIVHFDVWQLHALGVVALNWTACESNLLHLLAINQRRTVEDVRPEAEKHDTTWQMARLREAVKARKLSDHVVGLIENATQAFDACRLNRNALLHAGMEMRHGSERLHLNYRPRKTLEGRSLADDVNTIRGVADEIKTLNSHLSHLWENMMRNRATTEIMLSDTSQIPVPTLL